MGTISRATGTPYVDGDILPGARLEGDISTLYDVVNGDIDDANLADDAVTTPKILDANVTTAKLASGAVTQAKMTDGAATASEETIDATTTLGAALTTLGSAIVHTVGNPARHVIIIVSFFVNTAPASSLMTFRLLKDGTSIHGGTTSDFHLQGTNGPPAFVVTRMYVDASPTAGGSHTYEFKAACSSGAPTAELFHMVVFEPRS
jgi:hypothetical protein